MESGGFDVVIGNPPYVLGRETFDRSWKDYIPEKYDSYGGKFDLYIFFIERALSVLREGGQLGYIVPNTILANVNATSLRQLLLASACLERIRVFGERVFEEAQVESVVVCARKEKSVTLKDTNLVTIEKDETIQVPQVAFKSNDAFKFNINLDKSSSRILSKLKDHCVKLGKITDICIGIQLGGSSGKDQKESFLESRKKNETYKKVLDGKDINRYVLNWPGVFVRYGRWLHRKREEKYFLNPKIILRQIGESPIATFDDQRFYTLNTIYNLIIEDDKYSPEYIIGFINSKLGRWVWKKEQWDFKSLFPKIKKEQLEAIPIRTIDFTNPAEKQMHDELVALVDQMLELHKQLNKAAFASEEEPIERQIAGTDKKIDQLVYQLYGLTAEEIKIVEGM